MREILISGSDYFLDTVIGYEGEHNSTNLNIKLPSELISNDIDYYIVKFKTGKNKGVISQRLQQSGGYIVIPLVQDVTDFGVLEFQVEAWALDGDVVSRIAMTPTISRLIGKSVDSDGVLIDEEVSGLMAELQSLIANYPEKIVVERVEDLPENPEDGLDALVTGALPTGGAVKNDPFMQYFSIGGNWYKIGSEAIEYAGLYAPYAGYPFRVVQDAFYEFGQYDTPENISVKKGDCPLPSIVFPEGVHRSEAGFINEETGKSITIGVYDGTEADTPLELDVPYAFLHVFDIVQTTLYLNNFEQMEVDDGVLEPGCYLLADDGSPTAIDKSTIPEFKNYRLVHDSWFNDEDDQPPNPLNPQFLGYYFNNETLQLYYWNGAEYVAVGGEAKVVEYADLDAPYAGYPFRHTPSGKIVEQEHYILPLNVPLKLYVNPVPPLTDIIQFDDSAATSGFLILPPEQSGVPVNIAVLNQGLGLNENGEAVPAQYIYAPQEISFMGNSVPKGWNYLSLVDGVPDFTTLRQISYDEVPRLLVTIVDEYADEWEPAGGTYLSETPYLSEGSLYYWNGAEYVEVGGADLSAYATKEYVDENAGVTVNKVAPINGNITLDTSNIEPTGDRWYLKDADVALLYTLRGDNEGSDFPHTSFILSGSFNEINSEYSAIVAGGFNSVSGSYSAIVGGAGNLASGYCSATIGGEGLIASADYSAIVGKHGEPPEDSLFAVANGTDGDNKNIAFYVGGDGVSHFDEMPEVPAGRVINADNQLVDKKYVDENHANIREVSEAPESSTATGVKGETVYTNEAIYVCVDTNTWRKVALTSW